jgi:hypothetical protein
MAFTDQQILNQIQYMMIEPPDSGATWPSALWTATEVNRYLSQRQDRILGETFPYVTVATIPVTAGTNFYTFPSGFIAAISLTFTPTGSSEPIELTPSDSWEADHGLPLWTIEESEPKLYFTKPTLTFYIAPTPDTDGELRLLYIHTGTAFTGSGIAATVQDEIVPTLKYGTMADMLNKVGRANDPSRSQYCEDRFQHGIDAILTLINGYVPGNELTS